MTIRPEMARRIENIPWFAHRGEPFHLPLRKDVLEIASWSRAVECYHDPDWKQATNEAHNTLSAYLSVHHRSAFSGKWNVIVRAAKEFMQEAVTVKMTLFKEQMGLDTAFVDCVNWSILGAIMEDVYRDFDPPTDFFTQLLSIYEAGHFPCGWDGGEWPAGRLIVF